MSSSEIKNRVVGLAYVARTSRNLELAAEARQQLVAIHKSLDGNKKSLVNFVECHLAELTPLPRAEGRRERVGSGASDIANMLEEENISDNMILNLLIYVTFVFSIAMYISLVNNSLYNLAFRKN
jgi:hypothetical protein